MAANLGLSSMQNWWKTKQQNNGSSDIPSDDIAAWCKQPCSPKTWSNGVFLTENGMKMLAEGCFFFGENASQRWRLLHKNGRWMLWWWEKKWWQVSQKKSAVTICKLDYWVYISLIYSALWNQWKFIAYIVEIKMMTVFKKMMTQSVKIVKIKGVILLIFNTLA